ncbi:xanthine dehydrogenase family protein molybdopterin-binding subunit [Roseococcus thiosulfatophilus]|uniref:xanthine dehydrogenase family protein molybdopterin-binding subunit n=1 Tax=Roseococcus thiosulfatophilus TaxID=35813 RepID=UPI001A8DB4D0|nr:xanthine dehydrogenase family protein molybdopterin-binding subunit [Roseococcus thiosulfatophilus]
MGKQGVGAPLPRREDDRFLRGRGRYVADIAMAGMREVAFLRSPVAHGIVRGVRAPQGSMVFTMADLDGVAPIRAPSALPGFRRTDQWPLANGRVRQVGEPIAMVVAATRAEAEDILDAITLDIEELPPATDMLAHRAGPPIHEGWPDNVVLHSLVEDDISGVQAPIVVRRRLRTARQHMAPLEGRGVVARWDTRLSQLEMHTSSQMVHVTKTGLAECLGLPESSVRIISPDVGGGFGYKGILLQEEVAIGWLARRLEGTPLRWIEDRREGLAGQANCREHHYDITVHADHDGTILALDCEAHVDVGAYSAYPFSACLEGAQIGSILPGPYVVPRYRCRTWSVATNKPPILPYRGVARTGVCYALETTLDAVARAGGLDPIAVRLRNLPGPADMPYTNVTKKIFDSGDYPEALRRAAEAMDREGFAQRQREARDNGRLIGQGFAIFCEQGAHGTSVYHGWGIPFVPGAEPCQARLTPDGGLELRVGVHSHGQGMETTLAQVAHEILGVPVERVWLIHGDTALTPYSTGTWGSRCAVMAGGAVAEACTELRERLLPIGRHLLQAPEAVFEDGAVRAGAASVSVAEMARVFHRAPQNLTEAMQARGLECTAGHKTMRDTGTFSYAAHAVEVEVDPATGHVDLLRYVIVEDGGVLLNPLVADGQVLGGTAQGIGTALFEEMPYDAAGQPLASTFADYMLPGASDVPDIEILHMETPSPISRFGQKGIGESGAIGPPAAIVNAINDAIAHLGREVTDIPATPERVLAALAHPGRPGRGGAA